MEKKKPDFLFVGFLLPSIDADFMRKQGRKFFEYLHHFSDNDVNRVEPIHTWAFPGPGYSLGGTPPPHPQIERVHETLEEGNNLGN